MSRPEYQEHEELVATDEKTKSPFRAHFCPCDLEQATHPQDSVFSSSCHRRSSFCRKVPEKPLLESTWSYSYTLLSAPATRASRTAGSSRGLLVTLGGRCLSQFRPQGLPQDNLSLVIHLMGWVLPLGPEISPSLHHSWVRPVTTPPPCDFLRGLAVDPCPPASPPVPGWGPILGLTY